VSELLDDRNHPHCYLAIVVRADGSPVVRIPIAKTDDEAAKAQARTLVDGHAVDLWDGLRFVERFEPN
jgi:hypothetical protein